MSLFLKTFSENDATIKVDLYDCRLWIYDIDCWHRYNWREHHSATIPVPKIELYGDNLYKLTQSIEIILNMNDTIDNYGIWAGEIYDMNTNKIVIGQFGFVAHCDEKIFNQAKWEKLDSLQDLWGSVSINFY
jgi:hypothetical protein